MLGLLTVHIQFIQDILDIWCMEVYKFFALTVDSHYNVILLVGMLNFRTEHGSNERIG